MTNKKEERAKWVAALRSGEYRQGKSRLEGIGSDGISSFCCLGVYCKVADVHRSVMPLNVDGISQTVYGDGIDTSSVLMPHSVAQKIGLTTGRGSFDVDDKTRRVLTDYVESSKQIDDYLGVVTSMNCTSLTLLNDAGVPFSVIADIIELDPPGLFYEEDPE